MGAGERHHPGDPGDEDCGVEQSEKAAHGSALVHGGWAIHRKEFVDGDAEGFGQGAGYGHRWSRIAILQAFDVGDAEVCGDG